MGGFSKFFTEHFLKKAIDYDTWDRQLRNKGWERKGEGSFGVAYVHPNKNYIYKIFRDDPGYDFFLKFALQNQKDKSVVRLKRIVLTGAAEAEGYLNGSSIPNVIVLEKLTPLRDKISNYDLVFNASFIIMKSLDQVYKDGMTYEQAIAALLDYAKKQYASAYKYITNRRDYALKVWRRMINLLRSPMMYKMPIFHTIYNLFIFGKENGDERYWDLHDGNLMYRESTGDIVLTDPFV